jgi:CubicO group peptidase (beta-lactamase class C family)
MRYVKQIIIMVLIYVSLFLILVSLHAQYYPDKGEWQRRTPAGSGMDSVVLQAAVEFAKANEYSGLRDLLIAIHNSFGFEPFNEIVGPTKELGGPAGIILKDGYTVTDWGDIHRVDMDGMKVQSVSGGGHSGGGLFISTADPARFGLLFEREGAREGNQILPGTGSQSPHILSLLLKDTVICGGSNPKGLWSSC